MEPRLQDPADVLSVPQKQSGPGRCCLSSGGFGALGSPGSIGFERVADVGPDAEDGSLAAQRAGVVIYRCAAARVKDSGATRRLRCGHRPLRPPSCCKCFAPSLDFVFQPEYARKKLM